MDVKIGVTLNQFQVPDFVLSVIRPCEGMTKHRDPLKFALAELDAGTIEKLCQEFTKAVFAKAGKCPPDRPTQAPQAGKK